MTDVPITFNGTPTRAVGSVGDLLAEHRGQRRPTGVAVAVNDEVVRRDDWDLRELRAGDRVEVVTAVQGG